jgi:hypothetical protein
MITRKRGEGVQEDEIKVDEEKINKEKKKNYEEKENW